jgi:hypothetical protein
MTHPLDLTVDEPAVRGHVTAASVRREIIHALAGGGAMTPAQVRRAVAQALPSTERPSIVGQVRVLRDGGYVTAPPCDSRQLTLTAGGELRAAAITALADTS